GPVYQIIPGGYTFSKPVTLQVALSTAEWSGDAARVGLYQYNLATGGWDLLASSKTKVQDAGGRPSGTLFTDSQVTSIASGDAYIGLFTSTAAPAAPALNAPATPTEERNVFLSGAAQAFERVNVFFLQAPPGVSTAPVSFAADGAGLFGGSVLLPAKGHYELA